MSNILSLFVLFLCLSACGSSDHVNGSHAKREVTFKSVENVVSGTFAVPADKKLTSVQLSYDGFFTNNVMTADKCLQQAYLFAIGGAVIGTGERSDLTPYALYCQDNSFYFSRLTADSGVIRATLNDSTYLYLYFDSYTVSADITIISKDDWHNEDGTSLKVH